MGWRQKNFKEDKKDHSVHIRASKMAAGPWRPAEDLQNTESSEEQRNFRRSLIGRSLETLQDRTSHAVSSRASQPVRKRRLVCYD